MDCFVIMPFAEDFDDVYGAIRQAVGSATSTDSGRCFRLDDAKPAGRITNRLIDELNSASFCVADITGTKPNVMWELGYVMALGKPTIVITQDLSNLPFDIQDVQTIEYVRNRLAATLTNHLKNAILDTLSSISSKNCLGNKIEEQSHTIGDMRTEISELKQIVYETVVSALKESDFSSQAKKADKLQGLSGHWFNTESQSHVYSKIIRDELVTPYCFMGDDHLTGIYYGWKRIGEYWFARYKWINSNISGFTFLKPDAPNSMIGSWWSAEHENRESGSIPKSEGVPAKWTRKESITVPDWAEQVFTEVENEGLASYLAKNSL
jgi:hypothetical protein